MTSVSEVLSNFERQRIASGDRNHFAQLEQHLLSFADFGQDSPAEEVCVCAVLDHCGSAPGFAGMVLRRDSLFEGGPSRLKREGDVLVSVLQARGDLANNEVTIFRATWTFGRQ